MDGFGGGLRAEPFRHGGFLGVRPPPIAQRQTLVREQTRRRKHRQVLGDLERDALVLGDRFAERVALLGALDGLVERLMRPATPGSASGTSRAPMPRAPEPPVRANTMHASAMPAKVIDAFSPL